MYKLENDQLLVIINPKGAELQSLYDKHSKTEYMWDADPAFWAKHSPVLFPIVGALKNNTYEYEGKNYEMSRHGFARDKVFVMTDKTSSSINFNLVDDDASLAEYPFHFSFSVIYTLEGKKVSVTYLVKNNEEENNMFFSVGGHPAFNLPIAPGLQYEDYYLLFNKTENAGRWPISKEGLICSSAEPLLENTDKLPLRKALFYKDAIVLKSLQSDSVQLRSDKNTMGFEFSFKDFPFLGIWAARDANFICIEPWCGVADAVDTNRDFSLKEGINMLKAGDSFERTWSIHING